MGRKTGKLNESIKRFPMTKLSLETGSEEELKSFSECGISGAVCGIRDFLDTIHEDCPSWQKRIGEIQSRMKEATEEEMAAALFDEAASSCAKILMPLYEASHGKNGRFSMPVMTRLYRSTPLLLESAMCIGSLGRNMTVAIPYSPAGVRAMEEAVYRGVTVQADFCFSLAQAVQAAEGIEKGLRRRESEGLETASFRPYCSFDIQAFDEWIAESARERGLFVNPESLICAGILLAKKIYRTFSEKGYRTRLLIRNAENEYAWSKMLGGKLTAAFRGGLLQAIDGSTTEVKNRIDEETDSDIPAELMVIPEFRNAYRESGSRMKANETSGVYRQMMTHSMEGFDELVRFIRGCVL